MKTSIASRLENTPAETVRGIAIFVTGSAIIPSMDAVCKLLIVEHGLSPAEVSLIRLALQGVLILPLLLRFEGPQALRTRHLGLNLIRGALLGIAGLAFFGALRLMPLADATAVFLVEPMIVTLLSAIFLKETIGWRRITAVLVGFAGALIIIRPSYALFGAAALLPAAAALLIAVYFILSRYVSRSTTAFAMQVYAAVGGVSVLALTMMVGDRLGIADLAFTMPGGTLVWVLLIASGAIGTFCHLLFNRAYQLAPASVLAPFGYMEIVSALILGLVVFGDFPDALKWLGMTIVVGSGLFIYVREKQLARVTPKPPAMH
ncbi:DMT family transporter [Afifella sp. IM 167]|uniref:DMT family transporter n=1 Tax=Afifella sp. IM 167 TaxID=2033586 RepID=UPI001CCB8638|nr:DMT family transporter [Afifella sp. IM 167]